MEVFNLASKVLMEKARKAYFKIEKTIGLDNPCKLLKKLFDRVTVNTKFTTHLSCRKFCIYYHPINSKLTTWQ